MFGIWIFFTWPELWHLYKCIIYIRNRRKKNYAFSYCLHVLHKARSSGDLKCDKYIEFDRLIIFKCCTWMVIFDDLLRISFMCVNENLTLEKASREAETTAGSFFDRTSLYTFLLWKDILLCYIVFNSGYHLWTNQYYQAYQADEIDTDKCW